jgi:hypothetical protein
LEKSFRRPQVQPGDSAHCSGDDGATARRRFSIGVARVYATAGTNGFDVGARAYPRWSIRRACPAPTWSASAPNSTSRDDATGPTGWGSRIAPQRSAAQRPGLASVPRHLLRRCAAAVDRSGESPHGVDAAGAVRSPPHSWRAAD